MGQMPSYEERLGQMEAVLKGSVTSQYYGQQGNTPHTPSVEVLRELSDSHYTVYDVLSAFFEHDDPMVPLGMPVYIVRGNDANDLFMKLPLRFMFVVLTRPTHYFPSITMKATCSTMGRPQAS